MKGRLVKIKLAGSSKEYEVNLGLLRKHSAFFRKAFDKDTGMKEAIEGCIELQDVTSEMVQTYIYWLYDRTILLPDGSESEDMSESNFLTFPELYVFADIYDTRALRNDIVEAFIPFIEEKGLTTESYGAALRKLPQTSKLYGLILCHFQSSLDLHNPGHCEALAKCFPREVIGTVTYQYVTEQWLGYECTEDKDWLEEMEL